MSAVLAVPLFAVSVGVTLTAARLFARRLDTLGGRFAFPEALIGLLTAVAADGPEITSALVALAQGAHGVSTGVLVGSNLFNLAAMVGLSALLAGSVWLPRAVLAVEGTVALVITWVAAAVLLGWLAPAGAAILDALVLAPYFAVLVLGPRALTRLPAPARLVERVTLALDRRGHDHHPAATSPRRTHHLFALVAVDMAVIVAGSFGMVQSSLALADHWHVARPLLGVLVLAPLTSVPNAVTAVRLGLARRGSALVGETLNSNTINLVGGVVVPALFVAVSSVSVTAKVAIGWLIAATSVTLGLLALRGGMSRRGGAVLVLSYVGFVAYELAAS